MDMEVLTTKEQWQDWSAAFTMLPYVARYKLDPGGDRPLSWENAWKDSQASFVLESGKSGRYTFLGNQPKAVLEGRGDQGLIRSAEGEDLFKQGKPLQLLKEWMAEYRSPAAPGVPKFTGGCVGYFSYDMVRSLEKLPAKADDDLAIPDYVFMRFDEVWVIDHELRQLYCAVHTEWNCSGGTEQLLEENYRLAEQRARRMKGWWDDHLDPAAHEHLIAEYEERVEEWKSLSFLKKHEVGYRFDHQFASEIKPVFPKPEFIAAVQKIQDYIAQGDVFQVNLSVRQTKSLRSHPEEVYEWLRVLNPSPYMGLLRLPQFQLVSASPELLVQVDGTRVRTRPIAGTRPRGETEKEDAALAKELIENEKERAEHIMLVDLLRNDLGRVSRYGTVKVDELMVIESYSHVMHIVSEVKGELASGRDAYDVIAAIFPGGTITGAPKIRTMEIIEELEPVRRGPYTGSLGWIDYNGNMELNIVIRTLLAADGAAHVQAGAGIVIDSIPEKEYVETLNKAKALWKAVELSERKYSDKAVSGHSADRTLANNGSMPESAHPVN